MESENYYGFVTGVDGELIRLDFGNSLSNNPITNELNELDNLFFWNGRNSNYKGK